ncbi:MAG: BlaI/MecI/CopY family transcriptional regulator [Clostridia bacterium]|nr:BlaI/MecI/CopY family transcriptional regulator [Clostridia bacterium]
MKDNQLGEMEARFAELIWERAPIPSGELVKLCDEKLGWKKSTTYTMLRRLVQRGIFESRDSIVSTRISREEFASMQSERFVEETFGGSLPAFLAAFTSRKKLSEKEVEELLQIIERGK